MRVLGPSLLCTVQLDKVGELELPHRGKCFDVRSGQHAEEIYDLRTNGASSLWSARCLLSYQEELSRAHTANNHRSIGATTVWAQQMEVGDLHPGGSNFGMCSAPGCVTCAEK